MYGAILNMGGIAGGDDRLARRQGPASVMTYPIWARHTNIVGSLLPNRVGWRAASLANAAIADGHRPIHGGVRDGGGDPRLALGLGGFESRAAQREQSLALFELERSMR